MFAQAMGKHRYKNENTATTTASAKKNNSMIYAFYIEMDGIVVDASRCISNRYPSMALTAVEDRKMK